MGQVRTYTGAKLEPLYPADDMLVVAVKIKASQTIAKGTLLGQVTATGAFAAYNNAASDGTETARAIAQYDMISDADGNIVFASSGTPGDFDAKQSNAPVIFGGACFAAADLAGVDANGLADLGARYILGTSVIRIP